MRRGGVFLALGWLILALEAALEPFAALGPFRPDLVAVLVLVLAIRGEAFEGLVVTFFLAQVADLLGGGHRGLTVVTLAVTFLVAVGLVNRVFLGNVLARATFGFFLLLGRGLLAALLLTLYAPTGSLAPAVALRNATPQALCTAVAFVVLFPPLTALHARLSPVRDDFRG